MSAYPSADDYSYALEPARMAKCVESGDSPLLQAISAGKVMVPRGSRYAHVANGFFAYIYRVKTVQGEYALRCPRRQLPQDNAARLHCLAQFLQTHPQATYLVEADHFDHALFVSVGSQGGWFPIQVMGWIEGKTLLNTVAEMVRAGDTQGIGELAEAWKRLLIAMKSDGIVHGDLHPDNIIVSRDKAMRLVDYDTLIVPGFTPKATSEGGMATYLHPGYARRQMDRLTTPCMDDFGALNILLSLQTLASDPSLRLTSEYLLFSVDDIESPATSRLFMTLAHHSDPLIAHLANDFFDECQATMETGNFRVENYLPVSPATLPWHQNLPASPQQAYNAVVFKTPPPMPATSTPSQVSKGRKTWDFVEQELTSSASSSTVSGGNTTTRHSHELNDHDVSLPSSIAPTTRRSHPYDPK